ncbi:ElyC/SanA/YdcF family protein [Streptomyces sp. NPDC007369]|uniref:ElyC/SanA/YdcF family protein n=1 Tax=Streptomyces sp. NPDC007369 TaxID=3154589 RepID=UPI0033E79FDD
MDFYSDALGQLPPADPGTTDGALDVQVVVEGPGGEPRASFGLVLGPSDAAGRWWGDSPAAAVRLTVPYDALRDARGAAVPGTGLVMSGRVTIRGDLAALARAHGSARGPAMRSYLAHLAKAFGHPAADTTAPVPPGPDVVAVLAAPNDDRGALSVMAQDRSLAALTAVRTADTPTRLVLTGGFGAQFNTSDEPHWRHCARWLAQEHGMRDDEYAACLETRHSSDDALFLREFVRLRGAGRVTVVTSDYHATRVRHLLGLVLPGATVLEVSHPALAADHLAALRAHDETALGKTVAATLLFGPDRLTAPLHVGKDGAADRFSVGDAVGAVRNP